MFRPNRQDQWLALLLLVQVMGLIAIWVIYPVWIRPWQANQQQISTLLERKQRVLEQIQQTQKVQQELQQTEIQWATLPAFLPEATVELAASGLMQRLETTVSQVSPQYHSCAISHRSPYPVTPTTEPFVRVVAQVRLRCGISELTEVLHQLENGSPRLFIENIDIFSQPLLPAGSPGKNGLDVSFDLVGYHLALMAVVTPSTTPQTAEPNHATP